jgi:hypothetical protein
MGSTITVGKHAAAFRAADGLVYFALYEKTYESNVSPKTPRWSCIHFGTLDSAIQRIFDFGGSCEGGMLCGPARRKILPEKYIGHWLRLMKAPHAMPDRRVTLRTGDGFANAFSSETCARGADVFNQAGFGFIADEIAQGNTVSPDLHAYAGPLARLWADKIVHPWRIIEDGPCLDSTTAPSLGYNPTPARAFTVRQVEAYRADENNILMRDADGNWRIAGWAYSIVGDYVRSLGAEEQVLPGSYRTRIEALRAALEAAPPLPEGTTVRINPGEWTWRCSDEFRALMDGSEPFTVPAQIALENCITFAKRDRVNWRLPGGQDLIAADLPAADAPRKGPAGRFAPLRGAPAGRPSEDLFQAVLNRRT